MSALFGRAGEFLGNLSREQIFSLLLFFAAMTAAKTVVKQTVSSILTVLGVLFALYFVAPDLYHILIEKVSSLP